MAGPGELDQFVRKFVTLWQSGQNAKLFLETEAGNAYIHLQVGLGQAKHPHHGGQQGQQGGGPARQRRRARREEERKTSAEQAAAMQVEKARIVAENSAATKVQADTEEVHDNDKIPQVDGTVDEIISYDLEMESFALATKKDVVEGLEANFYATLTL